jgi:hypothetical protein
MNQGRLLSSLSLLSVVAGIAYFPGCEKQPPKEKKLICECLHKPQGRAQDSIKTYLGYAQDVDVPLPITFSLTEASSEDGRGPGHRYLRYQGGLSVSQTAAFYIREMERSGWDIINLCTSNEGFLYCHKPGRQCGIQIRPSGKPQRNAVTTLCLFVSYHE